MNTGFMRKGIRAYDGFIATTLNIPDTVGYSIPADFGAMIASLRQRIPNADKAVFSVHCHNDLGLRF
jgi:2-isopropylmalate synthase